MRQRGTREINPTPKLPPTAVIVVVVIVIVVIVVVVVVVVSSSSITKLCERVRERKVVPDRKGSNKDMQPCGSVHAHTFDWRACWNTSVRER